MLALPDLKSVTAAAPPLNLHSDDSSHAGQPVETRGTPIALLGVPFDNVTTAEAVALIERMVASGRPHYLATANVDFLVQALHDVELRRILFEAHLVLCDGTPLLWASRWLGNPLPERVAGSDLVPLLVRVAEEKGYRLFFLGGSPETAEAAVAKVRAQYPKLTVAGHYSPPFQSLLEMDHEEIKGRIQEARPDLLFVCFGCPKQEKWIAMHYRSLQVPVSIGVGGTIDFLAGRFRRAPKWMQQTGTEWVYRLAQEPKRLFKRYTRDLWYFGCGLATQWYRMQLHSRRRPAPASGAGLMSQEEAWREIECPEWLDAQAVQQQASLWETAFQNDCHCLLHLAKVHFIDSTGLGLLIRLRKRAGLQNRQLVLVAPSQTVLDILRTMQLFPFFRTARNSAEAKALLTDSANTRPVLVQPSLLAAGPEVAWQGEVTAANADEVWRATADWISQYSPQACELTVNLSRLTFIDSTGVGLMLRVKKHALKEGVRLCFTAPQAAVRNVIKLSQVEACLLED